MRYTKITNRRLLYFTL